MIIVAHSRMGATEEEFLDITLGSASVMGLTNDKERKVRLCVDEEVLEGTEIDCHPCINTSTIKFATKDLVEKIIPAMVHTILLPPPPILSIKI